MKKQTIIWYNTNKIIPDFFKRTWRVFEGTAESCYVSDLVLVRGKVDNHLWYGLATYEVDDDTHFGWVGPDGLWMDGITEWAYLDN